MTSRPWRVHLADERRKPSTVHYGDLRRVVRALLDGTAQSVFADHVGPLTFLHVVDGRIAVNPLATPGEVERWREELAAAGHPLDDEPAAPAPQLLPDGPAFTGAETADELEPGERVEPLTVELAGRKIRPAGWDRAYRTIAIEHPDVPLFAGARAATKPDTAHLRVLWDCGADGDPEKGIRSRTPEDWPPDAFTLFVVGELVAVS